MTSSCNYKKTKLFIYKAPGDVAQPACPMQQLSFPPSLLGASHMSLPSNSWTCQAHSEGQNALRLLPLNSEALLPDHSMSSFCHRLRKASFHIKAALRLPTPNSQSPSDTVIYFGSFTILSTTCRYLIYLLTVTIAYDYLLQ